MDNFSYKQALPTITISKASSPTDEILSKTPAYEPEMEDNDDNTLLKNLIKELGIEESIISEDDPLKHNPSASDSCLHCILVKKISSLQSDINKMNIDISSTNEILQLKKEQNSELKTMIQNLEENCGNSQNLQDVDNKEVNCSCTNKCLVF
jgi:hypothetical protein